MWMGTIGPLSHVQVTGIYIFLSFFQFCIKRGKKPAERQREENRRKETGGQTLIDR